MVENSDELSLFVDKFLFLSFFNLYVYGGNNAVTVHIEIEFHLYISVFALRLGRDVGGIPPVVCLKCMYKISCSKFCFYKIDRKFLNFFIN